MFNGWMALIVLIVAAAAVGITALVVTHGATQPTQAPATSTTSTRGTLPPVTRPTPAETTTTTSPPSPPSTTTTVRPSEVITPGNRTGPIVWQTGDSTDEASGGGYVH
jgi:cytoskeletal protein RodZ